MDAGGPSGKKHTTVSSGDGRGREVEDHELFGHLSLLYSPRSKQRFQRQKNALESAQREQMKKRPRSSTFSKSRHSDSLEASYNSAYTKKKHTGDVNCNEATAVHESSTQKIEVSKRIDTQTDVSRDIEAAKNFERASRQGCSPSPRTYSEINDRFAPIGDTSKLDGTPRLSSLALGVARSCAARGKLVDLSDLADSHVHEILGHKDMKASVLMKIESLNPSRINVLEASWARLVLNEFGERELPSRINWWRTFYEMKRRENQISLERARARLKQRYDAADANRNKRHMETTRVLGVIGKRKTKPSTSTPSRIAQLRMEMKRKKRRR